MKSRKFLTTIALAATLLFSACNKTESENPDQTEGTGYTYDELTNTYTINNANGLLAWNKAVQDDLTLNCTLSADIDMTDINLTKSDTTGTNWTPIGSYGNSYTGTFDGSGHTITGLTINQEETNYVGLIGCLGSGGKVQNLTLENVNITGSSTDADVGSVVGLNFGTVTDCHLVSGSVSGSSTDSDVGGVVGRNFDGTVTACTASGSISGNGDSVGGVVGSNTYSNGIVIDCHFISGSISGSGDYYVGGVVGWNTFGTVTACTASGDIFGSDVNVGGVVGWNSGTVIACYHTSGSISGSGDYVGGVVGENRDTVTSCYHALGSISSSGDYVGGVVGYKFYSTETACYWSDYNGNGIGNNNLFTDDETTKVDGTTVTWADAVEGMNEAIETWNSNNPDEQCDWKYELLEGNDLPTLTKNE